MNGILTFCRKIVTGMEKERTVMPDIVEIKDEIPYDTLFDEGNDKIRLLKSEMSDELFFAIWNAWQEAWRKPKKISQPAGDAPCTQARGFGSSDGVHPYCQPNDQKNRIFMIRFDDAEYGDQYFYDEEAARQVFEKAEISWNCQLFATLPRALNGDCGGGDKVEDIQYLIDMSEMLMEWCVKNVKQWHFPQYDNLSSAIKLARAHLPALTADNAKRGD